MKFGKIAVVGRPNVGKSTLFNQIIQSDLAIITEKAQTTRSRLLGVVTEPGRYQLALLDTPGVHSALREGINTYMNEEAIAALKDADLIWYLVGPEGELSQEEPILSAIEDSKNTVMRIRTKVDLLYSPTQKAKITAIDERLKARITKTLSLSTVGKRGLKTLLNQTLELLPEGRTALYPEDQLTDKPVRFFVTEFVRKQLLLKYSQEIPYGCAVKIVTYKEGQDLDHIQCEIVVERESQKPILIGQNGLALKEVGVEARREIEKFIGKKAFLGLKVSVLPNWSRDKKALENLGYHFL